jgi:hypothetical protein
MAHVRSASDDEAGCSGASMLAMSDCFAAVDRNFRFCVLAYGVGLSQARSGGTTRLSAAARSMASAQVMARAEGIEPPSAAWGLRIFH